MKLKAFKDDIDVRAEGAMDSWDVWDTTDPDYLDHEPMAQVMKIEKRWYEVLTLDGEDFEGRSLRECLEWLKGHCRE